MIDINFFLFKNESDLLDRIDKVANIIIAFFTLGFSVYIYIKTSTVDIKKHKSDKKIEFLKTIILERNMSYFFDFHENILSFLLTFKNRTISNNDKITISIFLTDEAAKYRSKFYDLLLPFDRDLYTHIKNNSDNLTDILVLKINDTQINYLDINNFENEIENFIIDNRNDSLSSIFNFQ